VSKRSNKRNNIENEQILRDIKIAQNEIRVAENFFQNATDLELIDMAIYELEAKKSKYQYLIRMAKEKGVKRPLRDYLIESMAK
jgi:hypothetical protein